MPSAAASHFDAPMGLPWTATGEAPVHYPPVVDTWTSARRVCPDFAAGRRARVGPCAHRIERRTVPRGIHVRVGAQAVTALESPTSEVDCEPGAWLRGQLYPRRSDISPDGETPPGLRSQDNGAGLPATARHHDRHVRDREPLGGKGQPGVAATASLHGSAAGSNRCSASPVTATLLPFELASESCRMFRASARSSLSVAGG